MKSFTPYYDNLPDFSEINRNVAWMTDPTLPNLLEETYMAIITNKDERPWVITVYDELCNIVGNNKRLNVAYKLEEKLISYLKSRYVEGEELQQQIKEFQSLIHYLQVLDRVGAGNESINEFYKKNPNTPMQRMNTIVYYLALNNNSVPEEFLCYSQAHFHFAHIAKIPIEATYLPLYAYCYKDNFIAYPAINFCQSLIEAQYFIKRVCKGNDCAPVTVKNFPIEPRNFCFDKYVTFRTGEHLKILLEDNDRPHTPDEYEAKKELLRTEMAVFDEFEEDPDMNPEAVKMARHLIERLKDELGVSDKSQPYCTYSVPEAAKSRDEIEADIIRMANAEAPRFVRFLLSYEKRGFFDFRGDSPRDIFNYMAERYDLPYSAGQFIRNFKR